MATGPKDEEQPAESGSDLESSETSEDEEPQGTANEIVNIDFEARSPEEGDFSSIQRLLKQLLPTGVNLSDMTNLILSQNYVGAVVFQPTDDGPAEPEDQDEEEDIFGVTTVVNLTAKADKIAVQELIMFLKTKFHETKDHAAPEQAKLAEFFSNKMKNVGWIINERFINLPSQIAPNLFDSLRSDITDAVKKSMPYKMEKYLLIAKAHVPKGGSAQNPVFVNDEEELFFQNATASFSYRLDKEADALPATSEWKNKKDKELLPIRVVMLLDPAIVDREIANFKSAKRCKNGCCFGRRRNHRGLTLTSRVASPDSTIGRIPSKPQTLPEAQGQPIDQDAGSPAQNQPNRAKFPRFSRRKRDRQQQHSISSQETITTMDQQHPQPMDVVQDRVNGTHRENEENENGSVNGNHEDQQDSMDTSEIAPDGVLHGPESLHPTSPSTGDVIETDRHITDSVEPSDEDKVEEDGDSRAEGVITFFVPDVRKLTDTGTLSSVIQVRNLPWRIMIMKRKTRSASHLHDESSSTLGYFLQCNGDSESTSWTCQAQAELRLIPFKAETPTIKRPIQHMFYNKENDWGFTNFLPFEELLDPAKGLVNPSDFSCTLQVSLQADPPHGVCWDSKKYTGYIGLKNQGATCYMNSLLQALYFTNKLRKALYLIPTEADDPVKSVPLAIQRVAYELQSNDKPVGTKKLTKSFGWETLDSFMQHDAQELCRVLLDNMDMKMKGTRVEGTIPGLFEGKMISFIRCRHVEYESSREESFMDIQLNVKDQKDVYESFDDYVRVEVLEGDNRYDAGDHGLQDAEKGIQFIKLPPVLHLQLKRFQFDPISENNIKINDRFEFPERLDLTKYIKSQPGDVPPVYFLHAVLVHSGDNHGGHYVVYISPEGNGKWCKFDDDVVVRCTKKEAIERNYGGSSDEFLQFRNCTNAYMLVYINESRREDILQKVSEIDIPGYLSQRLNEERDTEARRRKEKSEQSQYLNLRVVTEDEMVIHQGHELVDFEKIMSKKPYRVRKDLPLAQLKETLAEWFGYKAEQIAFWPWQTRQNGSSRPTHLMDNEALMMEQHTVQDLSSDEEDVVLFLEILPYRNPQSYRNEAKASQRKGEGLTLFFRYYDPVRRVLEYKGYDVFSDKITPKELIEACNQKAGFPSGTALLIFNDIKANNVDKLVAQDFPTGRLGQIHLDLFDGDLIVFQKALSPQEEQLFPLSTVKEFFKDLTFRTDVEFVDKERPNDDSCTFSLTLNLKMTYSQVVNAVAARLKTDPKRVQLFKCQSSLRDSPGSAIAYSSEALLKDLFNQRANLPKPKKLFYHHLDMDIDEMEARKEVKIIWQPNFREEGRELNVLINKKGTIKDLLEQVKKLVDLSPDGTGQLRLVEVMNNKILTTISPASPLEGALVNMSGNKTFRAEEIPQDQLKLNSDELLIPAAHFHKEYHHPFGIPFYFRIKANESFLEIKDRIQKILDVPDKEFEKYKFCIHHIGKLLYMDDDAYRFQLNTLNPQNVYSGIGTWLGIDHLNKTPKRPRPSYLEKAVKIYN